MCTLGSELRCPLLHYQAWDKSLSCSTPWLNNMKAVSSRAAKLTLLLCLALCHPGWVSKTQQNHQ